MLFSILAICEVEQSTDPIMVFSRMVQCTKQHHLQETKDRSLT